ncbi:3-hydroxyacyl-CoA dehydrogenase family protein, partial [Candidatus Bathyarchaeota archaeon]|nr:3-hydroxyacyl-CoA dehydrogenase family protein [Candidatus Bathyarchaeota archaeon]
MKRLCIKTNLEEALLDSDFVIESIYENLEVKRKLFKKMDALLPEKIIIASSTSGLMMSNIAQDMSQHPERAIVA